MPAEPLAMFASVIPAHVVSLAGCQSTEDYSPLFSEEVLNLSLATISAWPGYQPTRLVSLPGLARTLNVAQIRYKDEGSRFGLGSFKALGGAYAVNRLLTSGAADASEVTVTCATDGNHGLSVAWGAKTHGCRCVVFIHAEVSAGREQALIFQGAEVVRIRGNYDESVRLCYRKARENGWTVISDTSNDESGGDVARTVMAGYSVMASEIVAQLAGDVPTHVFVQGGVGGLAATVCEYLHLAYGSSAPYFVVVEPELAPCLFTSAMNGQPTTVDVTEETLMAGLSCGEVSAVAWPVLARYADHFLTIPDSLVAPAMRMLCDAPFGDTPVIAGESAVAGLAGFVSTQQNAGLAKTLQLDRQSRILVIGTEGATDPALFTSLTGRSATSIPQAGQQYP
jgi:diaminopropionate ammonia-lyase